MPASWRWISKRHTGAPAQRITGGYDRIDPTLGNVAPACLSVTTDKIVQDDHVQSLLQPFQMAIVCYESIRSLK